MRIYFSTTTTLFLKCFETLYLKSPKCSNLLTVPMTAIAYPDNVKFVIQVKSKLTSKTLKATVSNLGTIKMINPQIMCGVVEF